MEYRKGEFLSNADPNDRPAGNHTGNEEAARILERIMDLAYQSRNWLKLMGIISIASGVLYILSIWGIVFCWLPIWMGVLLYSAGNRAEAALTEGKPYKLEEYIIKLKTYFVIKGVLLIIGTGMGILIFIIAIFALITGGLSELLNNCNYNGF